MVEHKHRGTSKPLTIELTPYGLTPTGIGYRQMERTLVEVVPEHTRREMAHGVEIIVGHHLRLATGTAGEVHQHRVIVGVHEGGLHELRGLLPLTLPVVESLGDGFAVIGDGDILLHRGTL